MTTGERQRRTVGTFGALAAIVLLGACIEDQPLAPTPPPLDAPAFSHIPGSASEIVDLGTLGGTYSAAEAINDAGDVTGWSQTSEGRSHAFLWRDGVMTDLGTPGGSFTFSEALAINNAGQVVGRSGTLAGVRHAFLWQDGVMTDLGTLGGTFSEAVAINEAGQVVGRSSTAAGGQHAFLWQDGVMTDLGTLGGTHSHAVAINEAGQVVGRSTTAAGETHGFMWQNGVMTDLGTLGGRFTHNERVVAINEAGQVVGRSTTAEHRLHGFLWQDGVMTDLGTLDDAFPFSEALAINNAGHVVGRSGTLPGVSHAFLWQDGVMTELGTLGSTPSEAVAINNAGQVVGWRRTAAGQQYAFVWQNGVMRDLVTLGGSFSTARAINDAGEIMGIATNAAGQQRAVLWRVTSAQHPVDITPPAIVPSVAGTPGSNGWYTSNVTVSWSVTDDESAVGSTSGCEASIVNTDTRGQAFRCTATSEGGDASETVVVKRDASPPEIGFTGATDYTVDQDVAIMCNASDPISGIGTQSCPGASGPGYSFSLGTHTLNASATNNAGLGASASTSFTVRVTFASSSVLTRRFVTHAGNANSLVQKLDAAAAANGRGNDNSKRAALGAYVNEVEALTGRSVSAEHAAILIRLANAL